MLDTRFPRPFGDVGHPLTFGRPVRHRIVQGAWPREVVTSAAKLRSSSLLPAFAAAMRRLQEEGASTITTSCGFLVLVQRELQAAVDVPVVTSSLLQLPALLRNNERVGVLTISEQQLTRDYLLAAGVREDRLAHVVVQGVVPDGEFASAILGNRESMDLVQAQADVVDAAVRLQQAAPDVRHVVLECTNMPPYVKSIRERTCHELYWLAHVLDNPGRSV